MARMCKKRFCGRIFKTTWSICGNAAWLPKLADHVVHLCERLACAEIQVFWPEHLASKDLANLRLPSLVRPMLIPVPAIAVERGLPLAGPVDDPRRYARASGAPERIKISTPPALRSHSSGESGDARAKEVFDLHIQEMLERGEVSGSVAKAFHIFADQIRLLKGQVSSMRREWSDESQQTKDKVDRLAAEIATQSDAGRMRMIVQRFAREVIPDSKAIVRQAIDEQAEVVEQRINLLSHEVHESVKDNEASTDRLRRMIQENSEATRRSHAASEDETLKDLEKLDKRMFSVEKTVGIRTPAGELNLNPVAQLSDRASSSVVNANFRELNLKIEKALLEHETFAKRASESIEGINEEHARLANRVSRLQSGRGSQEVDRPSEHGSPQDWHEAIDEVNRKIQDLVRGVQRQRRDHDDIISRFETVKSHVNSMKRDRQL